MVDSSKVEGGRKSEEMWRYFGDKPITLTELLESSPEAQQLKKFNFDCGSDKRWGQNFSSTNNSFSRRSKNPIAPFPAASLNFPTSSTTSSGLSSVNLESSKLSLLDNPGALEPSENLGKRKLKKMRKDEREKTKGPQWFNLPKTEMNEERKNDLDALHLRSALDTKRFYKRNNLPTARPKYFQVGRIMDNPVDFYHSRVPRKQRKKTIAEEMVAEVSSTVSHL